MSKFGNLKKTTTNAPAPVAQIVPPSNPSVQANRQGRKAISGYFSPEMSYAMRMTAMQRGITLEKAMAEAFDMWLRQNGASPIGG